MVRLLVIIIMAFATGVSGQARACNIVASLKLDHISWADNEIIHSGNIVVRGATVVKAGSLGLMVSIRNELTGSSVTFEFPPAIRGGMPDKAFQSSFLHNWLELTSGNSTSAPRCSNRDCGIEITGELTFIVYSFKGWGPTRTVHLATSDFEIAPMICH